MATRYADIIDPEVIIETIPDDYQNKAKIIDSGIAMIEGAPAEGTQASMIIETLFEGDDSGQAIAMDSAISLADKSQEKYQVPLFWRADGALLQDLEGEITSKVRRDATLNISNAISRKASQIVDTTMMAVLEGNAGAIISNGTNYLNLGTQITLDGIEKLKATRGDQGDFDNGVLVMRGTMYHKLARLGLVTWSNATMTNEYRQQVQATGSIGQILGLSIFQTDKLSTASSSTDHYVLMAERSALHIKGRVAPDLDPIVRSERSFADIIKFKMKLGGGLVGMSWGGTASDLVTNTSLQTATNWSKAKTYWKDIPMCVLRASVPN